jgi:hypothetical protein
MRKRICVLSETPRQLRCVFMRYSMMMKLSKCSMSADSRKMFILTGCSRKSLAFCPNDVGLATFLF